MAIKMDSSSPEPITTAALFHIPIRGLTGVAEVDERGIGKLASSSAPPTFQNLRSE
jgi:hypothetical protein